MALAGEEDERIGEIFPQVSFLKPKLFRDKHRDYLAPRVWFLSKHWELRRLRTKTEKNWTDFWKLLFDQHIVTPQKVFLWSRSTTAPPLPPHWWGGRHACC